MIIDPIHWHPVLVHFTFSLLFLAPFFMLAGVLAPGAGWAQASLTIGRGMLWTGVIISVFTIGAGFVAMWNVDVSEDVHHHIHNHRNWALGTAGLFALLALWSFISWMRQVPENWVFLLLMFIGVAALVITGNKGGELVFYHGVAVKSEMHSPNSTQTQSHDEGHSH